MSNKLYRNLGKIFLTAIAAFCFCSNLFGQQGSEAKIRLNQVGFYPGAPKIAIVPFSDDSIFYVQTPGKKTVFTGKLKKSVKPTFAGNYTLIANFSEYRAPGKYLLLVPGLGYSYPFEIKANVHSDVAHASIKAYYFMRASMALDPKFAGKWARAEGHPDTAVLIHPSAASDKRPAGTRISSPRGWYDAGDYNKYIVNSGISTSTLMSLYEDFPDYISKVNLNIPESGNGVPDILNEVLWNLRWMLTMQDPNDGGVYHKLTNAEFDKFEMPDKATAPRYVVQKSTAATLDFAAVMAQATRIFRRFPKQLPGLPDSCLVAAKKAWAWAAKNRDVLYDQTAMNKDFRPKINTGTYGDRDVADEFIWAASELCITTKDTGFFKNINLLPDSSMTIPTWSKVKLLGYYTLVKNAGTLGPTAPKQLPEIKKRLIKLADSLANGVDITAYHTVMDKAERNFNWGSNSTAGNEGVALIQAYKLTGDTKYLACALDNLDYILGRNGTGYCYVTGYGSKPSMNPHHRPSQSDGLVDPVPGLLVGGPNPHMQDGVKTPSTAPDEAYIDDYHAYALNEIAINWNSALVYLANALEALQDKIKPIN